MLEADRSSPRKQRHTAKRVATDIAGLADLRQWAGLLNAIALVFFLANTVTAVRRTRPAKSGLSSRPIEASRPASLSVANKPQERR